MTEITLIRGEGHPRCLHFPVSPAYSTEEADEIRLISKGPFQPHFLVTMLKTNSFRPSSPIAVSRYLLEVTGPKMVVDKP